MPPKLFLSESMLHALLEVLWYQAFMLTDVIAYARQSITVWYFKMESKENSQVDFSFTCGCADPLTLFLAEKKQLLVRARVDWKPIQAEERSSILHTFSSGKNFYIRIYTNKWTRCNTNQYSTSCVLIQKIKVHCHSLTWCLLPYRFWLYLKTKQLWINDKQLYITQSMCIMVIWHSTVLMAK